MIWNVLDSETPKQKSSRKIKFITRSIANIHSLPKDETNNNKWKMYLCLGSRATFIVILILQEFRPLSFLIDNKINLV